MSIFTSMRLRRLGSARRLTRGIEGVGLEAGGFRRQEA